MKSLIEGDDGLPAQSVGSWVKKKHDRLTGYIDICRSVRKKFLEGAAQSAMYIELFCGPGRAYVEKTKEWVDGSAISAWKSSQKSGMPFSQIIIADKDKEARIACAERLRRVGAPVRESEGSALDAASKIADLYRDKGLHLAFLDPYNLEALDFQIIKALSEFQRIDILIHISMSDMQRNLERYTKENPSPLDAFAPGWRNHVDKSLPQENVRWQIINHWNKLVEECGFKPDEYMREIRGGSNQLLYWLALIAKHKLPQKFWKHVGAGDQKEFPF